MLRMASDGQSVYLTGSYVSDADDIWILNIKGEASLTGLKGRQLTDAFNRVVASGGAVPAIDVATGRSMLPEGDGSAFDLASADASGGVVAYDAAGNQLVRADNGAVVARHPLGTTQPVTVTNPLGQEIKAFTNPRVVAIAADAGLNVWYVDATARALVKVGL